jgi:hypothetical protein
MLLRSLQQLLVIGTNHQDQNDLSRDEIYISIFYLGFVTIIGACVFRSCVDCCCTERRIQCIVCIQSTTFFGNPCKINTPSQSNGNERTLFFQMNLHIVPLFHLFAMYMCVIVEISDSNNVSQIIV